MTDGHALRVAMVVYDDIALDSRVQREANALAAAGHAVTIFCVRGSRSTAPMLDTTVEIVAVNAGQGLTTNPSASPFRARTRTLNGPGVIHKTRWLISYARALRAWGREVTATSTPFDVWHAHDFTGLIAVSSGRTGRAACVYDVHDLFTDTGTGAHLPRPVRIALRRYERRLVKRVDLVVTVNRPLAEVIEAQCEPRTIAVVHNCPPVWVPPGVRPNLIREAAGISGEAPVILYHGALSPDRGVDRLCEALLEPGLETAHLALLGFGAHRGRYVGLAKDRRFAGRVHLLDPVIPSELLPWVASADVGAVVMQRTSRNLYLSTPNKLFECLAAGTPVVVSDFPAMRRIVLDDPFGPLGTVCNPSLVPDIARALRDILEIAPSARDELRRRCSAAARARWNWETEATTLVAAYRPLASRQGQRPARAGAGASPSVDS